MRNKYIHLAFFLCILLILASGLRTVTYAEETVESTEETVPASNPGVTTNAIPGWPQGPEIPAESAFVQEVSTDTILYAKNMDEALYPSSSVKLMTCLVALENSSLTDEVVMTATGVSGVTDGGAHIAAQIDEVFTMEQCLYAIMLVSANDVALQVAEHVGGSVEGFVDMMNQKAAEIGCTDTLFTNPTGLPDPAQHTTAHDLALITKAAMADETFRTICSTTSYTIPATNVSGGERALSNRFTMTEPSSDAYYPDCIGGKEGYTEASGSVLSCAATRGDLTLVCVVMMGQADMTDDQAIQLLNYAFDNFKIEDLGTDDFHVISGGTVVYPSAASADNLEIKDVPMENGDLDRTYLFGGAVVGHAIAEVPAVEDNSVSIASDKHLQEAADYSKQINLIPYFLIGAAGILLLFFLIRAMKKVLHRPPADHSTDD